MVREYLTGTYGLCLAFLGAFKRKEEEETWSSAARGHAPNRYSLGLTVLLPSEMILGCQNSLIDLLQPTILACRTGTTGGDWWERLLCDVCSGGYLEQVPASTNRHSRTFPHCSHIITSEPKRAAIIIDFLGQTRPRALIQPKSLFPFTCQLRRQSIYNHDSRDGMKLGSELGA